MIPRLVKWYFGVDAVGPQWQEHCLVSVHGDVVLYAVGTLALFAVVSAVVCGFNGLVFKER